MKTFEEVFSILPDGWLTEPEARLLWKVAQETTGPILEVGCYNGRSTCLLAALGRLVYAVDPFVGFDPDEPTGEVARAAFFANLMERDITNVSHFPCRIEEWVTNPDKYPGSYQLGFAYLDGDHSEDGTIAQITTATLRGAKVLAVHDVNDSGEGVVIKKVCLQLLGQWDERVERLAIWRLKK